MCDNSEKKRYNLLKSGTACSVCKESRRRNPALKLFKFPPLDSIFGKIWREKCKIENESKTHFICSKHFPIEYLGKKRLRAEAIPSLCLDGEDEATEEVDIFSDPFEKPCEIEGLCNSCEKNVKSVNFYSKKYANLLKKYKKVLDMHKAEKEKKRLKKKKKMKQLHSSIDALTHVSLETKTFCNLLLGYRPRQYSQRVRNLAMNIFYISTSTYDFLRNKLNLNLPHHSTLNLWAPIKFLQPGIENNGFESLKKKCAELTKDDLDHMVLLMDEMAIRKELKYNSKLDLIDGFEHDGWERSAKVGGQVCVFLLKSLYSNWSTVVNYFISEHGLTAEKLIKIVMENVKILANLGVKVRVLVCNQGSANRKCFSLLGVTVKEPFFKYEDNKIYCLYDFPHLVKSLRNGWLDHDLITNDGIVSFKVILELWEKELSSRTKMCTKLTRQHVMPNAFEKMRVKFATQVLSKTVQAAIRTIIATVGFQKTSNEVALSTANFILKIDKIFDCMNSCSLYSKNPYKAALQIDSVSLIYIKEFITYLNGIKFCNEKKKSFFLEGMKLTLNAVVLMAEEFLKENSNIFFIMTKAINQDKLENTFAILRQKGGNNNNPSVAELNNLLAKVLVTKIIKASDSSNCEKTSVEAGLIQSDVTETVANINENNNENLYDAQSIVPNFIHSDVFMEDVFQNSSNINLEVVSMKYFAGYVAFKILPKIDCNNCYLKIRKEDEVLSAPSELFIFHKNYQSLTDFGNLFAPSDAYLEVSKKHIILFHNIFQSKPHIIGIKSTILKLCKEATPQWFDDDCAEHREKLLDLMITVLLRKHCTWALNKGGAHKRKLKIINN